MSRAGALRKAKKLIKKKVNWTLPKKLIGDKDAYVELCKYILNGSSNYQSDDLEILAKSIGLEVFQDKDLVLGIYDDLDSRSRYDRDIFLKNTAKYYDRDTAFALIQKRPENLSYMSEAIISDERIVKYAVSKEGDCLSYASADLKDDRDVVRLAITNRPTAIKHASERIRGDIEMARYAVSKSGEAYSYISKELKGNKEITLLAVEDPAALAIRTAPEKMKSDLDVAIAAVRANGKAVEYVSIENRSEHAVISEAIKHSPELIKHASRRYLYSQPLLFKAVVQNSAVLEFVPEEMSRALVEMLDNYDAANGPRDNDYERD